MKSFFKIFFASLLALIIFTVMGFFLLIGIVSLASSEDKSTIDSRAVLVLDLSQSFPEQSKNDPFAAFMNKTENEIPSLYDMVRMIRAAKTDTLVKGIYIQCSDNANGYAASEELRKALLDFKSSRKFIYAYGETITQKAYYVASASDFIACHPQGGLEFSGMVSSLFFLKGMLEKLDIQPQIFYAGKFKSATEPFREYKMTDANRLQTSVWLGDLNQHMITAVAASRKIDTAELRRMAANGLIQSAYDAKKYKLVDDLMYDDQLKAKLNKQVALGADEKANYVTFGEYAKAADFRQTGSDRIAVIYANGDIMGGSESDDQIGSDAYRNLIRKLRLDNSIKAIVLRVNSPGGSALASDVIWREISLTREKKPVVVSMGNVAASGGYYISCNADSVFANENTITGSIGVFSIVPNLEKFFQNKLGVGFDRVKTAPYADMGSIDRPLTDAEKRFFQNSVDSIYTTFKNRVAAGRKMKVDAVDSIAQGRVWTGSRAITVGLADRIGTLQDAINCAARMSKLGSYSLREYPEKKTLLEEFTQGYKKSIRSSVMKENFSTEATYWLDQWKGIQQMVGTPQMKMPFSFEIR
ncbi:MAG: signal peptide peptidase SppA [Sediminibacterium sp.]|nr:signal peptide peptidase SppA [Sediminibacterium sp.]